MFSSRLQNMTETMGRIAEKKITIEIGETEIQMLKTKVENLSASLHPIVVGKNCVMVQNRAEKWKKTKRNLICKEDE